jgi:hypothetical protein
MGMNEQGKPVADTRLVEIYRAKDGLEATLFKFALESAGVRAQVISGGAVYPGLWWDTARILVTQTDAEKAAAILRDLEQSRTGRRNPRISRVRSVFAGGLLGYFIGPLLCAVLLGTRLGGWTGIFCLLIGVLAASAIHHLFAPPRPSR